MKDALLHAWKRQARRIDAMSLRERAILFGTLAVGIAAAADALFIAPRMAEQKAIASQMRQQTSELDTLRLKQAAAGNAAADTPQGRALAALKAVRAEQVRVDAAIAQAGAAGAGRARLPDLLERVLRRHERLTLVSLSAAPPPLAAASASPEGVAASTWQGVDLQVAGSYPDLVQYLADIEAALPGLRWGELQIDGRTQPPLLKLHVALLGERQ